MNMTTEEEKVSKLEKKKKKKTRKEKERGESKQKKNRTANVCGEISSSITHVTEHRERKWEWTGKIFKKIISENFPKLFTTVKSHIKETEQILKEDK